MSPTAMSMSMPIPMKAMRNSAGHYCRSSVRIRFSGNEPKAPLPGAEIASTSPLASIFRRRLLVGIGTASLLAFGANFLGSTSFLLGLEPELGRKLKLDAIYSIGGYTRCLEINNGFGTNPNPN